MRGFHLAADCFVSATRGEGFGLGAAEAKLCGNRVITTNYGAEPELCDRDDILVDSHEVEIFGMEGIGPYEVDQTWGDPDEEALVEAMRKAESERLPKDVKRWDAFNALYGPHVIGKALADNLIAIRREVRDD
jgi:glycosyltransferase involved in cell wall biosynthesis